MAGAALFTGAVLLGVYAVVRPTASSDESAGVGRGAVTVEITPGANASEVAETLSKAGVVSDARSFIQEVEERSKSGSLRPGRYRLHRDMAPGPALDLLLSPGSRIVTRVMIPEGLRSQEILTRLSAASHIPLADLQKAAKGDIGLPGYAKGHVEGFLFPATYEIEPGMTAGALLSAIVGRFRRAATEIGLERLAKAGHLTPLEAVTVASIVQAEGGSPADFSKIARVIYNRMARGGKLEMDTTVLYALGRRTLKVSESDTKVASPFNTYQHPGLPPGPISSPGESALLAALKPAKGDWYWFVTTDPGRRITKFTDNEGEFVKYREELNKYLQAH
ncbi:endolytic transglycosylase MltG [Streptosporangiaceae bacterium NEAU-GS5]|nr:endolytic transglycosylase MltG [Streptosporangiaceae bacterium NEAU-GS5]